MTEKRRDGKLVAIVGRTRYGKTAGLKQAIAHAPRALVWDIRGEWRALEGFQVCESIPELARKLHEIGKDRARICYHGRLEDFPQFCQAAMLWIQLWPAVIAVDEVADVTDPGKARGPWGELTRKGLYYGAHIYAASQRPQEADTTLWGNASVIRSYGLSRDDDAAYIARYLRADPQQLLDLEIGQYLERAAGEPTRSGALFG